jgi:hypothetical protein
VASISAVIEAPLRDLDRWLMLHLPLGEYRGTIVSRHGQILLQHYRETPLPAKRLAHPAYGDSRVIRLMIRGDLYANELDAIPMAELMHGRLSRITKNSTELFFEIHPLNDAVAESAPDSLLWPGPIDWEAEIRDCGAQLFEWLRDLFVGMSSYGMKVKVVEEKWDWVGVFSDCFRQFRDDAPPTQIQPEVLASPDATGAQQEDLASPATASVGDSRSELTSEESTAATGNQFVFRKRQETWEIAFLNGKPLHFREVVGFHYIQLLLRTPRMPLPVSEMAATVSARQVPPTSEANFEKDELSEYDPGFIHEVWDHDTKEAVEKRLKELAEARRDAIALNDENALAKINRETAAIKRQWKSSMGLRGRSRKFPNEQGRARSNVTKRITYAIEKINLRDPNLGRYLMSTIQTGNNCVYQPGDDLPHWELT